MYTAFFGLRQDPFSISPDPRYLFMSERHREALAHLLYGVQGAGGIVLLTGDVGTGKTTVCRRFLEQAPALCQVAYIFNPRLSETELLQSIADEFGIETPAATGGGPTVKSLLDPLNDFLLSAHAAGRNPVLIIDEAQNLSAEVLEQLRLLTNLETNERKLLQIVLIGQPELRQLLDSPRLEQLSQRVVARFHLSALNPVETRAYIEHRMGVAGFGGPLPWTVRALRRIHALSGGVPRRINLLCGRSLLGAFAQGRRQIGAAVVERAAREVFPARHATDWLGWPVWRLAPFALGAVAGAAALAGALALLSADGWLRTPQPHPTPPHNAP
jgi:general secretion pathway protein A